MSEDFLFSKDEDINFDNLIKIKTPQNEINSFEKVSVINLTTNEEIIRIPSEYELKEWTIGDDNE